MWHTVRISTANRNRSPTRRLPDRWRDGPGRSRASSRLPRLAAELADREQRTEFASSPDVARTVHALLADGRASEAVRLRRALFARCTTASRIKQRTVCQAVFNCNRRVCTLCAGLKPAIGFPYRTRLKTADGVLSVCARVCVCVHMCVCACVRARACMSVCLSVCLPASRRKYRPISEAHHTIYAFTCLHA